MLEVNLIFAGCARSFQTEPVRMDVAETSRFCLTLEANTRFAGCARSFRTELIWVDNVEMSRFCSMLEEILSFDLLVLFVEPLCYTGQFVRRFKHVWKIQGLISSQDI